MESFSELSRVGPGQRAAPKVLPANPRRRGQVFWTKKPRVGLDLGSYAVKCCVLDSKRHTCSIWSELLMPGRQSREEKLEGAALGSRVQQILKHCEQRCPNWSKNVNLAVEDVGSVGGYLQLPLLAASELATAIPSAVAKQIPYGLAEVELYPMRLPTLDGKTGTGIFFVAVPRAAVQERTRLVGSLGLELKTTEPAVFSLVRAVVRNHGENSEPLAVVSVGHAMTVVVVLVKGLPYFSREFKLGGADFTYAFQMAAQVSWARAEELKHSAHAASEKSYHLEPFLQRWLDEVKRSLAQAVRQNPTLACQRVLLTGGTAAFQGLPPRLAEHLDLPVEVEDWDRLRPASVSPEIDSGLLHYDIALGLALQQ